MNIRDALEWSRANDGKSISRMNSGWIAWSGEEFVYRLTFEELTAEDWEPWAVEEVFPHPEDAAFLREWTEAAGKPGYDKYAWMARQREIEARVYGGEKEKEAMKTVLIAEDNAQLARFYRRWLRDLDVELRIVEDGSMALEVIDSGLRPACIVSDVDMPRTSGHTLCAVLRARGDRTPLLLASGNPQLAELAAACGADAWSQKGAPGHAERIAEFVRKHVAPGP